ncbi:MAG: ABC transporter permease [Lachnospiraceae bacterium]|nr:ABC transporter permease [Lachnospiraceae bacterium]
MSSIDLLSMALRNLWKRKLRTFLTVLGVLIGTASIVVMISIGIGMNESYKEQAESWGSLQVINVNKPYAATAENKNAVINQAKLDEFSKLPYVEAVTPVLNSSLQIICGKYMNDAQILGIYPETAEAMGYKVSEGRLLNSEDKMVILVGEEIKNSFYNPRLNWQMRWQTPSPEINLLEDKVQLTYDYNYGTSYADKTIKPYKVEVGGILEGNGSGSYTLIMPLNSLEKILTDQEKYNKAQGNTGNTSRKKGEYEQAMVKVNDMNKVQEVQDQIKEMGFEAYSTSDYLETMKETSRMLSLMLGAIGAVSLFVAAIGITNTMVMAIYERTREIGIMKVIGASLKDIKRLFLTEAAFIGFFGGIIGILLSFAASKLVNFISSTQESQMLSLIPPWLCLMALLFATFVGIAAGYFPAKRAMKLSALSAIKTE